MEHSFNHPLMRNFSFQSPTKIIYGLYSLERLKDELKKMSYKNALLVTGSNVCKTPGCSKIKEALGVNGSFVEFNKVCPEPDTKVLAELAMLVRKDPPDLVVGLGGGSSMDMSKIASALTVNEKDPVSYFKGEPLIRKGPPIMTIPTIAGTGSEVTPFSIVVEQNKKLATSHYSLYPTVAVVDPTLSLSASPQSTASAGIDALCHGIESIMSVDSNPVCNALAFDAISNVDDYFERAYCNGDDIEARNGLSMASVLSGMAFTNTGLCLAHGIAYTYAMSHALPHGTSVALAEPYALEFNTPAIPEKIELIAAAMGIDTSCMSTAEVGYECASRIVELLETTHQPQTLDELNMDECEIEPMVDDLLANQKRFVNKNPRKPSREELIGLYERMFEDL
ncbi:MAG: iron-containing alcohol dehydrogenase [Candidatus Methanomethylicus sp.]|nr:iron-containing alcohol dehydrogenase [Candidatus Methanomethylicus sp.]